MGSGIRNNVTMFKSFEMKKVASKDQKQSPLLQKEGNFGWMDVILEEHYENF